MNGPPRDPDDWFDEPAVDPDARTRERPGRSGDDWFGLEGGGRRRPVSRKPTSFRILLAGGIALVLLLIGLAAGGVFAGSGTKQPPKPLTTRTVPTTTQAPTPTVTVPSVALKLGAHGTTVKDLQHALGSLGYRPGTTDGVFGPSTQRALIAFQTAHHLTPDGVLGPATRAAMRKALGSRP